MGNKKAPAPQECMRQRGFVARSSAPAPDMEEDYRRRAGACLVSARPCPAWRGIGGRVDPRRTRRNAKEGEGGCVFWRQRMRPASSMAVSSRAAMKSRVMVVLRVGGWDRLLTPKEGDGFPFLLRVVAVRRRRAGWADRRSGCAGRRRRSVPHRPRCSLAPGRWGCPSPSVSCHLPAGRCGGCPRI